MHNEDGTSTVNFNPVETQTQYIMGYMNNWAAQAKHADQAQESIYYLVQGPKWLKVRKPADFQQDLESITDYERKRKSKQFWQELTSVLYIMIAYTSCNTPFSRSTSKPKSNRRETNSAI